MSILYPITFVDDYNEICEYERLELADKGESYWTSKIAENSKDVAMCLKYKGASISLDQLPALVEETGHSVVFNGKTIEIYNGWRE